MKNRTQRLSRRHFLLTVGAGGAAGAAAIVSRKEAGDSDKAEAAGSKKGYHVTEHVQNYYRTAKI